MAGPRLVVAVSLLALIGCGTDADPSGEAVQTTPVACEVPNRLSVDGECLAPGQQDDGCPAGTIAQDDGTCLPAGIPAQGCASGFEPAGELCEPVLPAADCPEGELALMGETSCRPVMPCGDGTWGDLPVDEATTYVDQSYDGVDSDGSALRPWTTIAEGVDHAPAGGLVAVAAGSYLEEVEIWHKSVRLWGVCPSEVELVGGAEYAALSVRHLTEPAEIGGLAITSSSMGIMVMDVTDVLVERLWIHHTALRALEAQGSFGPASMTVRGCLVEGARELALGVFGATVDVRDTVLRDTIPYQSLTSTGLGAAVFPGPETDARSQLTLRNVLIERNQHVGINIGGSDVTMEGVVIRDTRPSESGELGAGAVAAQSKQTGEQSVLAIRGSVVERNRFSGVYVAASDALIETTTVRDTRPKEADSTAGWGVALYSREAPAPPTNVTVRQSLIEGSHSAGLAGFGGDRVDIESTVVRHTLPTAADGMFGRGIDIANSARSSAPPVATVRGCVFEYNPTINLFFAGADATVSGTLMQHGGRGLQIQSQQDLGTPSRLVLSGSEIGTSEGFGIVVYDTDAHVESTHVHSTEGHSHGEYGDGINLTSDAHPTSLWLTTSLSEGNLRAGISNFGSFVSLGDSALDCNSFDLDGETYQASQPTFEDRGLNRCGCGDAPAECRAVSTGLSPPPPPSATSDDTPSG